ncbi:MAG: class I SAM-dependent rRNA methyltransferase [Cytophagaceae bacterium]|jgi:23S rRNA (cytosine1962-C5)-methyltransferase|nr:class I SAM-dependent rRNA methyltransferase [Cytophagaceae bacterium]
MQTFQIILKHGKEQSLKRFHPWIFSGAIKHLPAGVEEGDLVEVLDAARNFLAMGHYQIGSIAVRIVSFVKENIDETFWTRKIENAYRLRKEAGLAGSCTTNAYRLIHGEGDGIPGLIIDMYAGTAVMQMHTVAMYRLRETFCNALCRVMGDVLVAVYDKSEGTLPFKAGLNPENGFIFGKSTGLVALENDLKFKTDLEKGQKTGFFVDQRENRALVERYSNGRSVLNMFCYTGGFSFYALRGKAALVHSVDSSERAIELTRENVALNYPDDSRHEAFASDAFRFMEHAAGKYDMIILDPPAFAKHLNVLQNALKGYRRLNSKAFDIIKPGGILFTFSCSQVVSREMFRTAIFSAAAHSGRNVRILHQLEQPADHPVSIYHPEGEYLKGLAMYVE